MQTPLAAHAWRFAANPRRNIALPNARRPEFSRQNPASAEEAAALVVDRI
jgi:hypothetical protein